MSLRSLHLPSSRSGARNRSLRWSQDFLRELFFWFFFFFLAQTRILGRNLFSDSGFSEFEILGERCELLVGPGQGGSAITVSSVCRRRTGVELHTQGMWAPGRDLVGASQSSEVNTSFCTGSSWRPKKQTIPWLQVPEKTWTVLVYCSKGLHSTSF